MALLVCEQRADDGQGVVVQQKLDREYSDFFTSSVAESIAVVAGDQRRLQAQSWPPAEHAASRLTSNEPPNGARLDTQTAERPTTHNDGGGDPCAQQGTVVRRLLKAGRLLSVVRVLDKPRWSGSSREDEGS